MKAKYKTAIFLLIVIILFWRIFHYHHAVSRTNIPSSEEHVQIASLEVVNVTVYYESLCSDSRSFILRQLLPTYLKFSNQLNIKLVPYGKAKTLEADGKIEFTCQHGQTECLGNKIHACAVHLIKDQKERIQLVSCMIDDNIIPFDAAERCAHHTNVEFNRIVECANGNESSLLLKEFGIETKAVSPTITFIPTIVFEQMKKMSLSEILKDFKGQLCNSFKEQPKECL